MTLEEQRLSTFDGMLAEMAGHFLSLPGEAIDGAILRALSNLGFFLGVERAILGEFEDDGAVVVRCSWAAPGFTRVPDGALLGDFLPHVLQLVRQGYDVNITDTERLPLDWGEERRQFPRSGAKAHLTIPFDVAGRQLGVLSFTSLHGPRRWPDDEVTRLHLVATTFANALARRNRERELRSALERVQQLQGKLEAENLYLRSEVDSDYDFEGIIGQSAPMKHVQAVIEQVAPSEATVLILGETGTGKELVARAIHARSQHSERPLVRVNCAALPSSLAESELFGHERGAFTGAIQERIGRFELADKGTIFLDEVGDLSLETQAKLLRVLQEGEFERLGSSKTRTTDARVIAATSRNLLGAVAEGSFRADLFYRISVVPIEVPPLRERREDIPALAGHFISLSRSRRRTAVETLSLDTLGILVKYNWPGNVRELENVIERAMILSPGPLLEIQDPAFGRSSASAARSSEQPADELATIERAHIVEVLKRCGGKVKGPGNAAERLGLNPSTLRNRMRKLRVERLPRAN